MSFPLKKNVLLLLLLLFSVRVYGMTADERMQFADGMYARGLYDMAIKEYLLLVRDNPDYPAIDTAFFRIAESYRRLKKTSGAMRFYQRLVVEHPDSDVRYRAELRMAELDVANGKFREAINRLSHVVKSTDDSAILAPAWYYIGYADEKAGDPPQAVKAYTRLVETFPDSPFFSYAALALGDLYGQDAGKASSAVSLYRLASENAYTPRIGAEALFKLGDLYYKGRDYTNSASAYARLYTSYPDDFRAKEAALQAAWSYYRAGLFRDSLNLIEQLSDQVADRDQPEWLYIKANCLKQTRSHRKASGVYQDILEKYPDSSVAPASLYEWAVIHYKRDEFKEIVRDIEPWLTHLKHPEPDTYWMLAESYYNLGQEDPAARYYLQLVESWPLNAHAPEAIYRMAEFLQKREDFEQAMARYIELVDAYPQSSVAPDALFASAYCMTRLDRYDEAIGMWDRLLHDYPESDHHDRALYRKAMAEIRLNRDTDAARSLKQLLRVTSDLEMRSQSQYWLGVMAENKNDLKKASERYASAVELASSDSEKQRITLRRVLVLQKIGDMEQSAELLQGLLNVAEQLDIPPALLYWQADYQFKHDRPEKAIDAARILVERASDARYRQIGWYIIGASQDAIQNADQALYAYKQSVSVDTYTGEGAEAAVEGSKLAWQQGDYDTMRELLTHAEEKVSRLNRPDLSMRTYFNRGRWAEATENWEQAANAYMSVAVLFDNAEYSPEALYRAAQAFDKLGRGDDEAKTLEELKTRYPDSEWSGEKNNDIDGRKD